MQGFVKSYFNQQQDVGHSQKIMYYFKQADLPVLTTLALEFAVFNRWFASIPGPTICNRAFAHYGTSFGRVDMNLLYINEPFKSIYDRLINAAGGNDPKVTVTADRPFEKIEVEDWQANFDMNLVGGVMLPCQEFGPAMASRRRS